MASRVARDDAEQSEGFQFDFHAPDFPVPEDVQRYTREKLEAKLQKFSRRLHSVTVHVRDQNGPKGGPGLACHMEARLAQMEPVNVVERDTDLRASIDLSIDALTEAVHRHVEKVRDKRRQGGRKMVRNRKLASP